MGRAPPQEGGPRAEPEQEGFTGWTIKGKSIAKVKRHEREFVAPGFLRK